MNNKIDYELEASNILEEHNIEEASASMVRSVDTNKGITYKHNTFELRNAHSALLHAEIREYHAQTELLSAMNDNLVDARIEGSHDKEAIYGFDDPNEIMSHKKEDIEDNQEFFLDSAVGKLKMFWLRYGCTHISCLLYTKSGKLGRKQTQIAKIASTGWYNEVIRLTDNKELINVYDAERQQLSYRINGNISALKSATTPAVKQGNLFEKQALTKLVQVQDREKKLNAYLDQQPLVVKEQVNK
jgi:hypothetical protein